MRARTCGSECAWRGIAAIGALVHRALAHPLAAAVPVLGWAIVAAQAWHRFNDWWQLRQGGER